MPPIFKALATIGVWVLFIVGVGSLVWSGVELVISPKEASNFSDVVWSTFAVVSVFLAVVAMKLRQMLE